jgi:hypothetical protein
MARMRIADQSIGDAMLQEKILTSTLDTGAGILGGYGSHDSANA